MVELGTEDGVSLGAGTEVAEGSSVGLRVSVGGGVTEGTDVAEGATRVFVAVQVAVGVSGVADGLLVDVGTKMAVCVTVSVGCCVGVGLGVLVCVAEAVRVGASVGDGTRVCVALTNGTSVGETKRVAVELGVGGDAVGVAGDCQRQIRIAEVRQYSIREVSSATASTKASSFCLDVRRANWSVALRTLPLPNDVS